MVFWKLWVEFDENNDSLVAMLKQSKHETVTENKRNPKRNAERPLESSAFFFQNLRKKNYLKITN